jgi:hypothetical protein
MPQVKNNGQLHEITVWTYLFVGLWSIVGVYIVVFHLYALSFLN